MERSKKQEKGPRRTRYLQYYTWADTLLLSLFHRSNSCWFYSNVSLQTRSKTLFGFISLLKKEIGPEDAEYDIWYFHRTLAKLPCRTFARQSTSVYLIQYQWINLKAAAPLLRDQLRQNLQRRLEFLGRTKSLCCLCKITFSILAETYLSLFLRPWLLPGFYPRALFVFWWLFHVGSAGKE